MKLWLIDYESSQWCGGQSNVVVHAEDADHAQELASEHMDEAMRELFADHYDGESEDACENEQAYSVNKVEEFNPDHDEWKFFMDEGQRRVFYPEVGGNYFKD